MIGNPVRFNGSYNRDFRRVEYLETGGDGLHAYFVHSYELKPAQNSDLVAQADYGGPLTAIVGRDNMVGTQFHPEKSGDAGLQLLSNWVKGLVA